MVLRATLLALFLTPTLLQGQGQPAAASSAQFVRGTVTDTVSRLPIAGSIIMATGADGGVLARTIANERGIFQLGLPARATGLRVIHIGFRPRDVPLARSGNATIVVNVALSRVQTMLDAVVVRENSNCSARKDRSAALSLYEQVRDGLLATIVAREASPAQLKRIRYDRTMERNRSGIARQEVFIDSVASQSRTFAAVRTARQFMDLGFLGDSAGTAIFYAPDAETIVDDAFRLGYCFQIGDSDKKRPNQVALDFAKAKRSRKQVDIEGSIWVDTLQRTLSAIEFRYVGLNNTEEAYKLGGRVQFREMANGIVLIDQWSLKLLAATLDTVTGSRGLKVEGMQIDMHETGGELVYARWADGSQWHAKLGTLRIAASDRDSKTATGTRITLEGTNYSGVVDATGEVEISDLLPGPYRAVVIDSVLSTIDIDLPTSLSFKAVRDSVHLASVVLPTRLDYAEARCNTEPTGGVYKRAGNVGTGDSQIKIGRVPGQSISFFVYVTDSSGARMPNVTITEAVTGIRNAPAWRSDAMGGKTDAGGRYFSCWNYAFGERVQVWIRLPGKAPQLTLMRLTEKVTAIRIVANAMPLAAASDVVPVTVRGVAFDSLQNKPLAGATVRATGLDESVKSDDNGEFTLRGVLPGSNIVTVQHPSLDSLGLFELEREVDVLNAATSVSVSIPSFSTFWRGACVGRGTPKDSGLLYGTIRDANTRDNLSNARVRVTWIDVGIGANKKLSETRHRVETRSDSLGNYAACGIPVDVALEIDAAIDPAATTTLQLGARDARVQHLNISLVVPESGGAGAPAGTRTGTVKGRITNTSGEAVGNVRVSVDGVVMARSDSTGGFVIARVPVGTRPVEFVAIGLSPVTRIVEVVEGQTVEASLMLDRVTVLEKVEVKGTRQTQILREFDERKLMGFGHIQDSTLVGKVGTLGSVVRTFPGVVPGNKGLEPPIYFRKAVGPGEVCEANYFVDRFRVDVDHFYAVRPSEVAWIEVYPRRLTVPPEFMGGRECGAVALFTKRAVAK